MRFAFCGFDFFDACLAMCLAEGHNLLSAFSQTVDGKYNSNVSIQSICAGVEVKLQERKITLADIEILAKEGCDFLLSAAYAHRIPAADLVRLGIRGINIHPSLLPEGRGPWPLPYVILKGLNQSGVTLHKLSGEFDAGEILNQSAFEITDTENLETLSCKVQMAAPKLLHNLLADFDGIWNKAVKQTAGSYWPMPSEPERVLDWNKSIEDLDRIVRAFGKFESWANFDGRDWLIQDATMWLEGHRFCPGKVVHRTNREVVVAARDGFVCIRHFQPESN